MEQLLLVWVVARVLRHSDLQSCQLFFFFWGKITKVDFSNQLSKMSGSCKQTRNKLLTTYYVLSTILNASLFHFSLSTALRGRYYYPQISEFVVILIFMFTHLCFDMLLWMRKNGVGSRFSVGSCPEVQIFMWEYADHMNGIYILVGKKWERLGYSLKCNPA